MLWTQASRVIQTVKRPSSLTHSITDSLTDSLTHIFKSTQAALPLPAKKSFHSFLSFFDWLFASLFMSYLRTSAAPPCAVLTGMALKVVWTALDWPALLPAGQFCWWVTEPDAQQVFRKRNTQLNIQCFLYHPWGVLLVCVLGEDYEHICVCAPVYVFECIHDLNHHRRNFLPGQRMLWVISRLLLKCFECFQYNSVQFLGCSGWLVDYDLLSYQTFKAKCVVWEGVRLHARNREPL